MGGGGDWRWDYEYEWEGWEWGREGSVEKELREDLEYECNGGKDRGKRGPWRRDYAGI